MLVRSSILLCTLGLASPVIAQATKSPPRPAPAAPAPPSIPRTTFIANMNSEFGRIDANHDGKATRQEIEAFQRASALQAMQARNRAIFNQLDTNHDGQLSPAEFARFTASPPAANAAPLLQRFDTNHDGVISEVEYRAGTLANFDRLDADKDGVVSPAEMRAGGIGRH